MHAEFGEVVARVAQLLGQGEVVHVGVVVAEQALGVGDQRVEMPLRSFSSPPRPGRAIEHMRGIAPVARAVRLADGGAMSRT
jgi:hypothetical protein